MTEKVAKPWCVLCGRHPSLQGNEPMYLIPTRILDLEQETDWKQTEKQCVLYCGKHFGELVKLGRVYIAPGTDWMNLFTMTEVRMVLNDPTHSRTAYILVNPEIRT